MQKSVLLANMRGAPPMLAQFHKTHGLLGTGLLLEGPFRDRSRALAELSKEVKSGMGKAGFTHPVGAVIATLAPQNLSVSERSWLSVPFLLRPNVNGSCASAGDVASSSIVSRNDMTFREADLEDLHMLGVAVLRSLGVPSFFAYQHFDADNPRMRLLQLASSILGRVQVIQDQPCILVPGDEPQLFSLLPPFLMGFGGNPAVSSIEVLSDDALLSLNRIKGASGEMLSLMRDMKRHAPMFQGEASLRAMGAGHALQDGISLWELEEADEAVMLAARRSGSPGLANTRSIRHMVEEGAVHTLVCQECHIRLAINEILCAPARDELERMREDSEDGTVPLEDIHRQLAGHSCLPAFTSYLSAASTMVDHLHDVSECGEQRSVN